MIKLLVKKQLEEIFRIYLYDAKKNKVRSKASTIMFMIWFAVLMIGVLGGIFTALSIKLCGPMVSFGMGWLYYALLGLLAILLGTFGSVFNTFSSLYMAKDNDLLLSMPIPVSAIMISRLLSVYIMGLGYSIVVIVPAWIVYMVTAGITVGNFVGGILITFLISAFVMMLSCILGWAVARISLKLKNKSIVTVLVSLVFIAIYYFLYYKAQGMITDLLANLALYGAKIKGSAYVLFVFGSVGEGDVKSSVIGICVTAAAFILMWRLMSGSFLKVATFTGKVSKASYHKKDMKQQSISKALLDREFRHFISSSGYMLNNGLGVFLMLIGAVAILWKGKDMFNLLVSIFGDKDGSVLLLFSVMLCGIISMNIMTAPSVSLEGKSLWLAQSLPIKPWQVLSAKLNMQIILNVVPLALCIICTAVVYPFKVIQLLVMSAHLLSYVFVMATFGLFMGVMKPILTWTNEIMPIKQSAAVMITMFGGFAYTIVLFGGYMMLSGWKLGYISYICIFIVANIVIVGILYRWLKTRGCSRFASL